mgnify:CR=1 FL=1
MGGVWKGVAGRLPADACATRGLCFSALASTSQCRHSSAYQQSAFLPHRPSPPASPGSSNSEGVGAGGRRDSQVAAAARAGAGAHPRAHRPDSAGGCCARVQRPAAAAAAAAGAAGLPQLATHPEALPLSLSSPRASPHGHARNAVDTRPPTHRLRAHASNSTQSHLQAVKAPSPTAKF